MIRGTRKSSSATVHAMISKSDRIHPSRKVRSCSGGGAVMPRIVCPIRISFKRYSTGGFAFHVSSLGIADSG
jgi:hypothetical protein